MSKRRRTRGQRIEEIAKERIAGELIDIRRQRVICTLMSRVGVRVGTFILGRRFFPRGPLEVIAGPIRTPIEEEGLKRFAGRALKAKSQQVKAHQKELVLTPS